MKLEDAVNTYNKIDKALSTLSSTKIDKIYNIGIAVCFALNIALITTYALGIINNPSGWILAAGVIGLDFVMGIRVVALGLDHSNPVQKLAEKVLVKFYQVIDKGINKIPTNFWGLKEKVVVMLALELSNFDPHYVVDSMLQISDKKPDRINNSDSRDQVLYNATINAAKRNDPINLKGPAKVFKTTEWLQKYNNSLSTETSS